MSGYCCDTSDRRHRIIHLFYIDDLKLHAFVYRDFQQALMVVQEFTNALGIEFWIDKCALVYFRRGNIKAELENACASRHCEHL